MSQGQNCRSSVTPSSTPSYPLKKLILLLTNAKLDVNRSFSASPSPHPFCQFSGSLPDAESLFLP